MIHAITENFKTQKGLQPNEAIVTKYIELHNKLQRLKTDAYLIEDDAELASHRDEYNQVYGQMKGLAFVLGFDDNQRDANRLIYNSKKK